MIQQAPPKRPVNAPRDFAALAFVRWLDARVTRGRFASAKRAPVAKVGVGETTVKGVDFCSEDSLALAKHPEMMRARAEAVAKFGNRRADALVESEDVVLTSKLEAEIGAFLETPRVTLYPSGRVAGYSLMLGLVRTADHVVIDEFTHNGLVEGASAATPNVHRYRHLDVANARGILEKLRAQNATGGILLVTESFFPNEADSPDLGRLQAVAREFGAFLVVDVANDLGCQGPCGTGQLGKQDMVGKVDIVVGDFSKTLGGVGGFVATCREEIAAYFRYVPAPSAFSTVIPPVEIEVVRAALQFVAGPEGERRREVLRRTTIALRGALVARGLTVLGAGAPCVPVRIGTEAVGREVVRLAAEAGVVVALTDHAAGNGRGVCLRLMVNAAHDPLACEQAATVLVEVVRSAQGQTQKAS